jgi:hypothetical protein
MRGMVGAMIVATLVSGVVACKKRSTTNDPPTNPSPTTTTSVPPSQSNNNPIITSMNFSPTFLVSGLTTFQGTGSASDADGDALSFTWSIGSLTLNGQQVSGTLTGDGNFTARLTVNDTRGGSASDTRQATLGTMAGNWNVTLPSSCGNASFPLSLTQNAGVVLGQGTSVMTVCAAPPGSLFRIDPAEPGRIDANGNVELRVKVGIFLDFYIRGPMQNNGRSVAGIASGSGLSGPATMTKQ